jgi:hypothetical protein
MKKMNDTAKMLEKIMGDSEYPKDVINQILTEFQARVKGLYPTSNAYRAAERQQLLEIGISLGRYIERKGL